MSETVTEAEGITLLEGEEVLHNEHPSLAAYIAENLMLSLISFGLFPYLFRMNSRYAITDERVIRKVGLLSTSSAEYRIEDIKQISTGQSIWEKLLGAGNIQLKTAAGGSSIYLYGVNDHENVANTIRNEMR